MIGDADDTSPRPHTGVPGLVMAKLGWHVTLTDKGVAVPMLRENVEKNDLGPFCNVWLELLLSLYHASVSLMALPHSLKICPRT